MAVATHSTQRHPSGPVASGAVACTVRCRHTAQRGGQLMENRDWALYLLDEGKRLICFTTEMAPGHHLWVRIDPSPEIEVLHRQRADIVTRIAQWSRGSRNECSGFRICRDEWN